MPSPVPELAISSDGIRGSAPRHAGLGSRSGFREGQGVYDGAAGGRGGRRRRRSARREGDVGRTGGLRDIAGRQAHQRRPASLRSPAGGVRPRRPHRHARTDASSRARRGVYTVAFSPDGTRLVSGSSDHTVIIWDVATGLAQRVLEYHVGPVNAVSFSSDGGTLASGSYGRSVVWDVRAGYVRRAELEHIGTVSPLSFSPRGGLLATTRRRPGGGPNTITVWDMAAQTALVTLDVDGDCLVVCLSPDGKRLVFSP